MRVGGARNVLRTVPVVFALLLWVVPAHAGIDRWPELMGLQIGMKLTKARSVLEQQDIERDYERFVGSIIGN